MNVSSGVYSKTCLKRPLKRIPKLVFKADYRLMEFQSIATDIPLIFRQYAYRGAFFNTFDLH